jgi:hypothetical protein
VKTPTPEEIQRLKDLCMRGRRGEYIRREDTQFLEMVYFGKYEEWWEANKREIQQEVWDATKPFGAL